MSRRREKIALSSWRFTPGASILHRTPATNTSRGPRHTTGTASSRIPRTEPHTSGVRFDRRAGGYTGRGELGVRAAPGRSPARVPHGGERRRAHDAPRGGDHALALDRGERVGAHIRPRPLARECTERSLPYAADMEAACGGAPGTSGAVDREYHARSPVSTLWRATSSPWTSTPASTTATADRSAARVQYRSDRVSEHIMSLCALRGKTSRRFPKI